MNRMSLVTRRKSCRLCNGTQHTLILKLAPSPIADAYIPPSKAGQKQDCYPMDLYLCESCGHAQILDVIDPSILYRDYIYVTTSSMGLSDHFKGYAEDVVSRLHPPKGSLVVDIGSNDGTLLRHFQSHGMNSIGVEPAREIATQATKSGVETIPEFFGPEVAKSIRTRRGPACIITMNNLFANIDDLQSAIDGIRILLADDGVFVFETFYFADYIQNMVFDFMYHEHLSYFTVKPLSDFFRRNGLELIDVLRVPTKGGSIRCMVQKSGASRPISDTVATHIVHEEKLRVHQPGKLFEDFGNRIDAQKASLLSKIDTYIQQGKKIAGYGASASSTTLIYHFDLVSRLSFIIDDNVSRQGMLSPGCHLPIFSAKAIEEKGPAAIVLLAWRYHEAIVRKNQAFIKNGGQFLIPLPEFKIV